MITLIMYDLRYFEWSQVLKILTLDLKCSSYISYFTFVKHWFENVYWLFLSIIEIYTSYFSSHAASLWSSDLGNAPNYLVRFCAKLFPISNRNFGKVSVSILMGRISALNWVIWVGSDTWTDSDFKVRFYVTVFPDISAAFARNICHNIYWE